MTPENEANQWTNVKMMINKKKKNITTTPYSFSDEEEGKEGKGGKEPVGIDDAK